MMQNEAIPVNSWTAIWTDLIFRRFYSLFVQCVLLELHSKQDIFSMVQQSLVGRSLLIIIEALRSHKDTAHSVGLHRTTDRPDAETCTWNRSRLTRYIVRAPGGIRTHIPSKQVAADPRLRSHNHGVGEG
jgi:hypothetical protein